VIEVVGHGGAGDFFPGNSRASVEKALQLGVDRIEIDVQVAGDGTLVLVHDEHVPIHGRRTPLRQLGLSDLAEALDGLLTLDEAIALIGDRATLMIDLKSPGYERPVAAAIMRAGIATTTIVSSTYAWSLSEIRKRAPGVALGLSTGHISTVMRRNTLVRFTSAVFTLVAPLPLVGIARAIKADHLMLNYRICSPGMVRLAKREGLGVYPWTVNHPRVIKKMMSLDVTGIISNRPDLVREALESPAPM
jgi:glycerophosphoryl diester phosphodiesterase